jgi:2-amino-4-hydroxy-6-hydroxymethyldihydropteridine diphosphokinase
MIRAYLGFGSNLGDRVGHLQAGASSLAGEEEVEVVAVSSVYRSEPVGGLEQPEYLNAVVAINTTLGPRELLALAQRIEGEQGRLRKERWGPRTLDVDILLYGDVTVDETGLEIPHPRLVERRFALEPLLEVEPGARLPDGTPLVDFLGKPADDKWVRRDPGLKMEF